MQNYFEADVFDGYAPPMTPSYAAPPSMGMRPWVVLLIILLTILVTGTVSWLIYKSMTHDNPSPPSNGPVATGDAVVYKADPDDQDFSLE